MRRANRAGLLSVALLGLLSTSGRAAVLYDNLTTSTTTADCRWENACAALHYPGDTIFAAQQFTLAGTASLAGASVDALFGPNATIGYFNWALYDAQSNLPTGGALYSGSSSVAATAAVATGITEISLGISATLAPGTYFFAIQAVAGTGGFVYLYDGPATAGGATTYDGGTSWSAGYVGGSNTSIALALLGTEAAPVAEPVSLALLGSAVAGLVAARRRRR